MSPDMNATEMIAGLLDGTLRSAVALCGPVAIPVLSLDLYILSLCRAYRTTSATPGTMRLAAETFDGIGDRKSAAFSRHKASEETGHDILALKDLMSLGLPRLLPEIVVPSGGASLVALFDKFARAPRPYGVFGYAYALEAVALHLTADYLSSVQRLVPSGFDITRCLRVHTGSDPKHVGEIVEHVAGLCDADRMIVIAAVQDVVPLLVGSVNDVEGLALLRDHLTKIRWAAPVELEAAS